MNMLPCHRALFNDDILRVIILHLPSPKPEPALNKNFLCVMHQTGDLARLSRVCKAISERALDTLWRLLYDIKLLLYILSPFKMIVTTRADDPSGRRRVKYVSYLFLRT